MNDFVSKMDNNFEASKTDFDEEEEDDRQFINARPVSRMDAPDNDKARESAGLDTSVHAMSVMSYLNVTNNQPFGRQEEPRVSDEYKVVNETREIYDLPKQHKFHAINEA